MAGYCGNCGSPVDENARFCPKCGKQVLSPPPQPRCPRCGAPVSASAAFCGACGEALQSAAAPADRSRAERKPRASEKVTVIHDPSAGVKAAEVIAPKREAAAPVKKPRKKKFLKAVAVLLVLALAFTGFISPGFFLTKREPGSPGAWAKSTPRPTVRPTATPADPTPEPARPTPLADDPEDAEGEEVFGLEDLYQLGTAGIDYALGEGPGSLGYREMDGYGVETLIAWSQGEVEAAPLQSATATRDSSTVSIGDVTFTVDALAMGSEAVTLRLRPLGRKTDEPNGYWADTWELSLAGQGDYGGSFEVSIPCPRGREMDVIAQIFDPALGRWTYVEYDVDFNASRVTVFPEAPGLIALFGMLREGDATSARPTANTLPEAGKGTLTSLADNDREIETLSAAYTKTLKLNLLPQHFQKAVRGDKDIEYQVSKNYERIQKQLEDGEYAALYSRDNIECYVSDNMGNILDGSALACSLVEYYAALPLACRPP